jgi:hypothetical protein
MAFIGYVAVLQLVIRYSVISQGEMSQLSGKIEVWGLK